MRRWRKLRRFLRLSWLDWRSELWWWGGLDFYWCYGEGACGYGCGGWELDLGLEAVDGEGDDGAEVFGVGGGDADGGGELGGELC